MTEKMTRRNFIMTSVTVAGGIVWVLRCNKFNYRNPPTTIPELGHWNTSTHFRIGRDQTPLSWNEAESASNYPSNGRNLAFVTLIQLSYGPSEDYLGKVLLPPHRSKLFLASKTDVRDQDGAWRVSKRLKPIT